MPLSMEFAVLALALIAALTSPPAERIGAYVEAHGGVNLAGAVDGSAGAEAETGAAFGLRAGYRFTPYVVVGGLAEFATLPVAGLPGGNFTFVGAEVAGVFPTAVVDGVLGVGVGYNLARGTYGDYGGFGGVRWRLGARMPLVDRFDLGLDYSLVMPRSTDTIERDAQTWRVVPAWLHQLSVVAALTFW